MKSINEIIAQLKQRSTEKYKMNVVRMGIPENYSIGVPTSDIRNLGKSIGISQELAVELWETKYHEARLLSILIMDIREIDHNIVEKLMDDVISWDLCDHICKNLIINLDDYEDFIFNWCNERKVYLKRAAYCLISSSVIKFKNIDDEKIDNYLELIKLYSDDSRLHVKKAISWALREIGKMNHNSHEKAVLMAHDLCESTDKNRTWVGKTSLKELSRLVSINERKRLISTNTKMGIKGS
ncbi:DNA alkylation repair protein [Marispirochaeta sp.]|jgi:3-methyladenine DNA glycosylase AlkD|uniref:DNA alkylation repair protein n=1 Tax=Marispirochaeta sp. TaxID=2038653 RepID=UPI0029C6B757|nr:DNA alkylation repair protein [Marispirochaeta sp.]